MSENEQKALQTTGETSLTFGEKGLQLTNFDDMWRFAQMVKRSGMCPPDRSPESIMISMQKGSELGFPLLESVHLIPTIKGRPTVEGKGMLALIQARGVDDPRGPVDCGCTGSGDDRVGWCESWRKGWPKPRRTEFSWSQAVVAGLTKPRGDRGAKSIYELYGEDMLQWKAVARHCNKYYGDILHGLMDTMTATEVYADVKDVTPQTLDELPLQAAAPDPLLAIEGASEPSDADVGEASTGDSGTSGAAPPEKCLTVALGLPCLRKFGHEGLHLHNEPSEKATKVAEQLDTGQATVESLTGESFEESAATPDQCLVMMNGERCLMLSGHEGPCCSDDSFHIHHSFPLDLEPLPTETAEQLDATQAMAERMTGQEKPESVINAAVQIAADEATETLDHIEAAAAEAEANEEPICGNPIEKALGGGVCEAPKGHPWDCITGEVFEEKPKDVTDRADDFAEACLKQDREDMDDEQLGTEDEPSEI